MDGITDKIKWYINEFWWNINCIRIVSTINICTFFPCLVVWTSITSPIPFVSSSADSDSLNSTLKVEKSCYQMFKKKL